MSAPARLYCLLCAELKTSRTTHSILDLSNGIKDNLMVCGQWKQSFERNDMPQLVCTGCSNELSRCRHFFDQIGEAEQKLLRLFPIKCDALMDEVNWGDIPEYNGLDGDDFKDHELAHFTEEVFCEPWIKTEPPPEPASSAEVSSIKVTAVKGRPKRSQPTDINKKKPTSKKDNSKQVGLKRVSLYKSIPKKATPSKSSAQKSTTIEQIQPPKIVERQAEKEKEPERPQEPEVEDDGSDLEDMTCRKCGKQFPNVVFLKVHKRVVCYKTIRDPENLLHCDICKATYRKLNSMRTHMKKHAGKMRHFCGVFY